MTRSCLPRRMQALGWLLAAWLMSQSALTEASIFLQLPKVKGGSADKDHRDWIELISVTIQLSRVLPAKAVGGNYAVAKAPDPSSPVLQHACATGRIFDTAEIDVVQRSRKGDLVSTYQAHLENVRVTSVSQRISGDAQHEDVTLSYDRLTWSTPIYTSTGSLDGRAELIWDFTTGKGSQNVIPDKVLRVTGEQTAGNGMTLHWVASPGEKFRIYASPTLNGSYDPLQDVVADPQGEVLVELGAEAPVRFFQVLKVD